MLTAALGLAAATIANADPEIVRAARAGDDDLLRVLVGRGADLSATDGHGGTALHVAAYRGDAEAVEVLLDHGARPNAPNGDGATPLLYGTGNEDVVHDLLAHGADPNLASKLGFTPPMAAAAHPARTA